MAAWTTPLTAEVTAGAGVATPGEAVEVEASVAATGVLVLAGAGWVAGCGSAAWTTWVADWTTPLTAETTGASAGTVAALAGATLDAGALVDAALGGGALADVALGGGALGAGTLGAVGAVVSAGGAAAPAPLVPA